MLSFPIVCACVWCAVSVQMVWATARTQGHAVMVLGRVVATPPVDATIMIVSAVSAAAALAMAIAVAYARGRRLERRMATELDVRWAELSQRDAGDTARRELLNWRLAELQTLVDRLLDDRRAAVEGRRRHLVVVPDLHASAPRRR